MESKTDAKKTSRSLSIIGTGDFACALAKRLVYSGYEVTVGSRHPERRTLSARDKSLAAVHLFSVQDACAANDVVIVAIHAKHYQETLASYRAILSGKIVIDVSNRKKNDGNSSNAEQLAAILPESQVVKAFNVVSAYALENNSAGESRRIFVAGEDTHAREVVSAMVRDLGFTPVDMGGLKAALEVENFVLTLFPLWKYPIIVALVLFGLVVIYLAVTAVVYPEGTSIDQIYLYMLNKALAVTALLLLALAYLPGCLAGFLQLWRGSKHQRFPQWLDTWLRCRKQFGLLCLALVVAHAVASALLLSPEYFPTWYKSPSNVTAVTQSHRSRGDAMTWMGESSLLAAVVAFVLLLVLGATSIPGVGDTLNWREWRFVQSYMGYITLVIATTHVTILGAPYWLGQPFLEILRGLKFLSLLLPYLVLLLKLILVLPCVSRPLARIRKGWERGRSGKQVVSNVV